MFSLRRGSRAVRATAVAAAAVAVLAACSSPTTPGPEGDAKQTPTPTQTETPTQTPTHAPAPTVGAYRTPAPGAPWQMVLTGDAPPDPGAAVYDLDGSVSREQLDAVRAANPSVYLVCYFSAGTWESWRSDADAFPQQLIGEALPDWPGERYVDVRAIDQLAPVWRARLDQCAAAGFDAVDPDNIDVYANASGFPITRGDVVAMMTWMATEAHARRMAIGQKNAPDLTADLSPLLDFAVVEECLAQGACGSYAAYPASGRPVFAVEYPGQTTIPEGYCDAAASAGLSLLVSPLDLNVPGVRCK